jgi:hypothetical protein
MQNSCSTVVLSVTVLFTSSIAVSALDAFKTVPPRVGVYGCMNQDAMEMPGLQFGIVDGTTYTTFDGGKGKYAYSPATGILAFQSGPFAKLRRSRETEKTFRILDEHGVATAMLCPWTPKNPLKRHW